MCKFVFKNGCHAKNVADNTILFSTISPRLHKHLREMLFLKMDANMAAMHKMATW